MKSILSVLALPGLLALACPALAGTDHSIARDLAINAPPVAGSDWEFSVGLPGWLTGIKGDIGVAGLKPVHVDLPFTDLVSHIDMVAGLAAEARHDRWSFFLVGLYEKLGADGDTPGRLVDSAHLSLKEVIAEAGLAYRVWEGKRGYFDLLAGARLIYIGADINFDVSASGVQAVSQEVAANVADRVSTVVKRAVSDSLPEFKTAAAGRINSEAQSRIRGQVDRILQDYPHLPKVIDAIKGGRGPVSDAIQRLIAAKVALAQGALSDATASVNSKVAAAKARARSRLQADVRRAEKNLANRIATSITNAIPSQASGSKSWVDPFVGFRARYNFTDKLFAMTRADIGGFGVGSDLAWQAYGALGWQFNDHWSAELGYRYLSEDYQSGGFVFDAVVAGAYLGVTYKF